MSLSQPHGKVSKADQIKTGPINIRTFLIHKPKLCVQVKVPTVSIMFKRVLSCFNSVTHYCFLWLINGQVSAGMDGTLFKQLRLLLHNEKDSWASLQMFLAPTQVPQQSFSVLKELCHTVHPHRGLHLS